MKNILLENDIKKMKLLIDHTIGQPISEQETLGDVEKVSLSWLENVSNELQNGRDITDAKLSKYGAKELILAYFPMADPNWKPNMDDVRDYIDNNVPEQKRIIEEINKELSKMDGITLVSSGGSQNLGSLDLEVKDFDLGDLNYEYKVILDKGRLNDYSIKYTPNFFEGSINLTPSARITDGPFKGSSAELETSNRLRIGFDGKINNDEVSLNFYPRNINVSTDWIGINTNNVNLGLNENRMNPLILETSALARYGIKQGGKKVIPKVLSTTILKSVDDITEYLIKVGGITVKVGGKTANWKITSEMILKLEDVALKGGDYNKYLKLFPKTVDGKPFKSVIKKHLDDLAKVGQSTAKTTGIKRNVTFLTIAGLISAFRIKLDKNKIYIKLDAFNKDWFNKKVGKIDVKSLVRKYLRNVNVTLPFDVIRKQKIPKSQESLNQLANNVAGGIKVEKS